MSNSWRHNQIANSRQQSQSFKSFDLVEYIEEEEEDQRRNELRATFRAAAFEAREKQSQSSYFEELLRKGLSEVQASYAVYGTRYALPRWVQQVCISVEIYRLESDEPCATPGEDGSHQCSFCELVRRS